LVPWWEASRRINYRRFFDVNELVGLRMDRLPVFRATHAFLGELIASGNIRGLRLDHIDGLVDPLGYLRRLRRLIAQRLEEAGIGTDVGPAPTFYLYVEKILGRDERLRRDWPVDGTTGYELGALINSLFLHPDGAEGLTQAYAGF